VIAPTAIFAASRPARARGLKHTIFRVTVSILMSRPARARGLKLNHAARLELFVVVAPRAGAWIETSSMYRDYKIALSRPARARGLKLLKPNHIPIRGVAPRAGAWIETLQATQYTDS